MKTHRIVKQAAANKARGNSWSQIRKDINGKLHLRSPGAEPFSDFVHRNIRNFIALALTGQKGGAL